MKKIVSIKIVLAAIISLTSINISAQNLLNKISNKASFVAVINGGQVLKDITTTDIENSMFFKESVNELFRWSDMTKPTKLSDVGVNINENIYFAYEGEQDMNHFYFTFKIDNLSKFETFVKSADKENTKLNQQNGLNIFSYNSYTKVVWKDNIAIYLVSKYSGKKYEADYYSYWKNYEELGTNNETLIDTEVETVTEVYEVEEVIQDAVDGAEAVNVEELTNESYYERQAREEKERQERKSKNKAIFEKNEAIKREKRNAFTDSTAMQRIKLFFESENKNKFTAKNFDSEAVLSFWYEGFNESLISSLYSASLYNNPSDIFGLQGLYSANYTSNLYFENDKIKLKTDMAFSDNLNESVKKVYSTKLDKKFCKYLSDKSLAYMSFSMSTEDLLNETSTVAKDFFNDSSKFEYQQEVNLYIDLLQIMLDEEAIAELATGDVVMVLNDLKSKEIEYTTYDYDENFNQTKVIKTKQELMPEFTFMVGSQNEEILSKIFKLSMKHHILSKKDSYFVSHEQFRNDLPFDMYFTFKEGILFMTNSESELKNILAGKAKQKIDRQKRKHITKSIGAMYVDMDKISELLLADEMFSKELNELNHLSGELNEFVLTTNYKKGLVSTEIYATTPKGQNNSSLYLLNLIDKMIHIGKSH